MLALRKFQSDAIQALKQPGHVICVAPTGSGKSLIYERLAARGLKTILVTPLIALARQQMLALERAGVRTVLGAGSHASLGRTSLPTAETGCWIVSPEMLEGRDEVLRRWKPDLLVVDECHCVWEWGSGFRSGFAALPRMAGRFQRSLWLTATLLPSMRRELRSSFPPKAPLHEVGNFEVPASLRIDFVKVAARLRDPAIVSHARSEKEAGILFVPTRAESARVAGLLRSGGSRALSYHAGLSCEERRNLEAWIRRGIPHVIVATPAFGMGMDFGHLRWAALSRAPSGVLQLAQAIGRVGRAGTQGRATVFWDAHDFQATEWMVRSSPEKRASLFQMSELLSTHFCRRIQLNRAFGNMDSHLCQTFCDFCSPLTGQAH